MGGRPGTRRLVRRGGSSSAVEVTAEEPEEPPVSTAVNLRDVVAATPSDRHRTVDLLRGTSLIAVAVGHWLLATLVLDDGRLSATSALAEVPGLQLLTWVFQVMPLFFLCGGVANLRSWASATGRGDGYRVWLGGRLRRLVGPTVVAVGCWVAGLGVLVATGLLPAELVGLAAATVSVPLWFLAVYLLVVAAAPAMLAWHRRAGLAVPIVLTVGAFAVDVAHGAGVPLVGWANFALVWLVPQQLGFLWADGRLGGRRTAALAAVGGLATLVALTFAGPYPVSVVGVPGAEASNNSPPTVVLLALALTQLGLVRLAEPALERWLQRPRVWGAVVVLNLRALTVYLWHLPVLVAVAAVLAPAGLTPLVAPGAPGWWATRPVWLVQLLVVLVAVAPLVGRLEDAPLLASRPSARAVPGAVVAGVAAFALLATHGVPVPGTAVEAGSWAGLAALGVAAAALRHEGAARRLP
ncbi:acyltransferase [Nitriliruptoraceae bacterium ZYF776]|nr:acyltransferase [Profundirhabdus halotolerans]